MLIPNRYSTQPIYFETEDFPATPFTPATPFIYSSLESHFYFFYALGPTGASLCLSVLTLCFFFIRHFLFNFNAGPYLIPIKISAT